MLRAIAMNHKWALYGCIWMFFCVDAQQMRTYISGDYFRGIADHIFDERHETFDAQIVGLGDIVFVKTDYLERFVALYHAGIKYPYILVTHNSDGVAPGPCEFLLEDPKIVAWFAQNITVHHEKLHPIPIGIANACWPHGNQRVFSYVMQQKNFVRDYLLYLNFQINTYFAERSQVYSLFANQPYCVVVPPNKRLQPYLEDLARSKFVLSPRGNGPDCHRTWEALYLGAIPVVRSLALDPLYDDLPVLIVQDWREISKEFLEKAYLSFVSRTYRMEKIYGEYWKDLIFSYKSATRKRYEGA